MLNFLVNPYFKSHPKEISEKELNDLLIAATEVINLHKQNPDSEEFNSKTKLIGVGNDANGKVYSLLNTKFCIKFQKLGKHVGKNQEKQFELNEECFKAISGKSVVIEGNTYELTTIRSIAVFVDEENVYTLMPRLDNTLRLWDEENIPFKDKDNWDVIREIKKYIREYGGEPFIDAMDVNGNNLMVDIQNKLIYLIDPYVPDDSLKNNSNI